MHTNSNCSSWGRFLMNSQAALSAIVLLFSYAPTRFWLTSVQSSGVKLVYFSSDVFQIDATEEVTTTLLHLYLWAPFKAAKVPSTAGLINSYSLFGLVIGKGDAVCTKHTDLWG